MRVHKAAWISCIGAFIFLYVGIRTVSHYNINWDEPDHFVRGQAYLHLFLTGKKTYADLPQFDEFQRAAQGNMREHLANFPRYSIYQSSALDATYHLANDNGHPPLNGILASLTNYVLYQRLGFVGDVESYHLFILFLSALLVFLVGFWVTREYGVFAGFVSSVSLILSPMFLSESHNNIKDPVEATFFAFFLFFFYKAVTEKRWQWMIGAGIAAGFALGTKFNILFAPFIVGPWLSAYTIGRFRTLGYKHIQESRVVIIFLLLVPLVAIGIFFLSWPFLWQNTIQNIFKIISYYREVGIGAFRNRDFVFYGFNTYPVSWIFTTTPLPTLVLMLVGFLSSFFLLKRDVRKTTLLWLTWFLIPIVRVSVPGSTIYGGTRQIMEYVPAMAILAGIGASTIVSSLVRYFVSSFTKLRKHRKRVTLALQAIIILSFIPITLKLISIHPNENLYFNSLIGGLQGAATKNFPGWGSTLGNPYVQGVKWINAHAEPNARLTLALGLMTTIPPIKLRSDIEYSNTLKSVVFREGEYIMDLTYYEFQKPYYDAVYPERFLIPVHQIAVDGVPILTIWKNDSAHTKPGFVEERELELIEFKRGDSQSFSVSLTQPRYLTRVVLAFDSARCDREKNAFIYTSLNGTQWKKEPEGLLDQQIPNIKKKLAEGTITHFLAAVPARYLTIDGLSTNSCLLDNLQLRLFGLRDVTP